MEQYRLRERLSTQKLLWVVDDSAARISTDYKGESLVVIGILKGAFIFLADLVRRIIPPVEVDFVRLSSYGSDSETSGNVIITKDVELPVQGRHVLVVEDIVDTGTTLAWYLEHLRKSEAESVRVCALVDKLERRKVRIPLDYVGLQLESGFLVGYGLDYGEKHRNLAGIYEVQFI